MSAGKQGDRIEEPARRTEVRRSVDVLVVGGGSSGLAAAAAAARSGASVLLVERYGFLGGTLTAVTLGSICGLYAVSDDAVREIVGGIGAEIVERLRRADGAGEPVRWLKTASLPYEPQAMKMVADSLLSESGVEVIHHSLAVAVQADGDAISAVIFESPDGRWACRAQAVIDCSGDGDIAALAGAGFDFEADRLQFPTTMFRFGGVDTGTSAGLTRAQLHECLERAVAAGYDLPRTAGGLFSIQSGIVHVNVTRVTRDGSPPNPLDVKDISLAEAAGRAQLLLYEEAFRRFVPGFEHCFVLDCGAEIGVRESRRVHGDYMLSERDVMEERRFDDAIACCAWPLEEHGADRKTRWVWLSPGGYYQIPLRCLIPRRIEGLLVAGRCASATHDAQASMRVAGTCFAMGHAAGVTAALAVDRGLPPRRVDAGAVQERLRQQGAFLG